MNEWLVKNSWPLIISMLTLVGTYSIYGYRLTQLEAQAQELEDNMEVIHEILQSVAVIGTKMEVMEGNVSEIKDEIKELNEKI